ncbi:MAG: hypothetical protein ACJ74O_13500 [Frankiaceae bacterium]|jgi:hypothetical protein
MTQPDLDLDALLNEAALPTTTVPICLRGDLQARFELAERQLADGQRQGGSDSLASGADARRIAEQIEALSGEMTAATVTFTLRAMPRPDWRAFVAKHPPRDGVKEDAALGLNNDTFWDALIRDSVIDPQLDDARWAKLAPVLTDGQYDRLTDAAWALNRRDVVPPRSRAASAVIAAYAESSQQPAPGG